MSSLPPKLTGSRDISRHFITTTIPLFRLSKVRISSCDTGNASAVRSGWSGELFRQNIKIFWGVPPLIFKKNTILWKSHEFSWFSIQKQWNPCKIWQCTTEESFDFQRKIMKFHEFSQNHDFFENERRHPTKKIDMLSEQLPWTLRRHSQPFWRVKVRFSYFW